MRHEPVAYLGSEVSNVAVPFPGQEDLCQVPFTYEIYTRNLNAEGIITFFSKILPVTVFLVILLAEGKLNQ